MSRRIKIVFAGVILMSGILNAAAEDTARTRYSVGIQLGAMCFRETLLLTYHVAPLVEFPLDNNFFLGFSPALGMDMELYFTRGLVFPDLLLQCDIRYAPDKSNVWYYFAGITFKKPFYDEIRVGKYDQYKTHKWHENFHITAGLGFRWTLFALDYSMIFPLFPNCYKWISYYQSYERSGYLYLSIGFRLII